MKFNINKWTLGLAAVGAVSMASAVRADDAPTLSKVETALSSTVISGYVSASVNYQGNQTVANGAGLNSIGSTIPLQGAKANGFNLDIVKLTISKAQDESPWAAGYEADLLFGPDAVGWNPSPGGGGDLAIQQAYIALRTPVGNGIDWKVGVFNTVVGYESFDAASNPNYTRSWGFAVEPTEHTGILGTYKVSDELSMSAGIANTLLAGINARNTYNPGTLQNSGAWNKTFMGSVTFSAPSSWGWASGSALYAGMVYGFAGGTKNVLSATQGTQGGNQANYYAGATLNSPWKDVTFGAAFDYVQNVGGNSVDTTFFGPGSGPYVHLNDYVFGLYNTIKATDKLSFNTRAEYWEADATSNYPHVCGADTGISLTETVEYDLWANVVSRVELRYDKVMTGSYGNNSSVGYYNPAGVRVGSLTSLGVYANVVYKF